MSGSTGSSSSKRRITFASASRAHGGSSCTACNAICSNSPGVTAESLPVYSNAQRGVAQPGSAPGWGPGGRRFKSSHPDSVSGSAQRRNVTTVAGYGEVAATANQMYVYSRVGQADRIEVLRYLAVFESEPLPGGDVATTPAVGTV